MSFDDDWEDVNVPIGSFIGWGERDGQHVTGEVFEYQPEGGTDFNGEPCPQLSVILTEKAASFNKKGQRTDFDPEALVTLNCGQTSLRRAVKAAKLGTGDLVRIKMKGIVEVDKGTLKDFGIQVKRGSGALSANAERALAKAAATTDGGDGFGGGGGGAAAQDDSEPPF